MKPYLSAMFIGLLGFASASQAVQYDFLPVASTGATTSKFTSNNLNGVINVTDVFGGAGAGPSENQNNLIFPSSFPTLFPGTGQVQGHLAQTQYAATPTGSSTSVVTFDLTLYNLTSSTVFGLWNITDEVTTPPPAPGGGGNPVYRIGLIDSNGNPQVPVWNHIGNEDNATQVQGRHAMTFNPITGEVSFGALINGGSGIHTDAMFFDQIPAGTLAIQVFADLPYLAGNGGQGDGVGYYFAEPVPEPASLGLLASGALMLLGRRAKARM